MPTLGGMPLRVGTADRMSTKTGRKTPPSDGMKRFDERAAEIAATLRTAERESAIRELAHQWAAVDAPAAERWAAAFADADDWERAMTHVCLEVAGRNPQEAVEIARWHELNPGTVGTIIGQWGWADFEAAAAWVRGLPAGTFQEDAFARLVLVRAETSPAEAASMASLSLAVGPTQEEAAIAVLHQWLRLDPEAAYQWVERFPDGELKERAHAEIKGMELHRAGLQAGQ